MPKRLLIACCLLASAAIGSLALLEGAARLLYEPPPLWRVWDPFAYRIPHPGLESSFRNPEGETVTVRLNELGMRGPSLAASLPAGGLTLVFLGGSATENYHLRLEDTFPERVGAAVAAELGRPVRVLNGGASGATSSTTLARLQHQVLDLHPELLVVMDGINDFLGGLDPGFRRDGRHLPRPPGADWRPRSYLWSWLQSLRPHERARHPPRPQGELHRFDWSDFPALGVYRRNLRSMAAIADVHGQPILFLTQGTMYHEIPEPGDADRFSLLDALVDRGGLPPDIPSLRAGMVAFNREVVALPQTPQTPFVHTFDLAGSLPQSFDLFVDECHLTAEGNRVAATLLSPVVASILREGAVDEISRSPAGRDALVEEPAP